jgi:MoxR-like ATPase
MTTTNSLRLSLSDCVDLIATTGTDVTYLLRGEMGIGKSSMEKPLIAKLEQQTSEAWHFIYIDCASMSDSADLFIPFPDRDEGYFERLLSKRLSKYGLYDNLIIMLDEFTKANRMVMQALHTLTEKRRRLGDTDFEQGRVIIYATGNLTDEGVGDVLQAHTGNRVTEVEVRKPTAEQWLLWAADNEIDPPVMAWVNETTQVLASFRDEGFDEDNAYVLNPKKVQRAVVTPRSLEKASFITRGRHGFSRDALIAALAGTIGEPAARDLTNFIEFQDQLPSREVILKSPETAPVPNNTAVIITLVFNLLSIVARDTITPLMKYVRRLPAEQQAVFCVNLARNPTKSPIAFTNAEFTRWAQENQDIL